MIFQNIKNVFASGRVKQNQLWIIDIDGTIIDVRQNQISSWLEMFQEVYGQKINVDILVSFFGKPFSSVLVNSLVYVGFSTEEILAKYSQALYSYINKTKKNLEKSGGKILPGAIEFLRYLGKLNILRMVVTGNPEEEATYKLNFFNLAKYYDIKIFAKNYHREREELVREAIKIAEKKYKLKLRPNDIKIVGDSKYDILSAKNLGFVSVGIATGSTSYEKLAAEKPDYLFKSLVNYKENIDKILSETK